MQPQLFSISLLRPAHQTSGNITLHNIDGDIVVFKKKTLSCDGLSSYHHGFRPENWLGTAEAGVQLRVCLTREGLQKVCAGGKGIAGKVSSSRMCNGLVCVLVLHSSRAAMVLYFIEH